MIVTKMPRSHFLLHTLLGAIAIAQPNPGSITTHPLPAYGSYVMDAAGNAYGVGILGPVTPGAAQTQVPTCPLSDSLFHACNDVHIMKVDASGTIVFGTLLAGPHNDTPSALTADAAGNVYVTGSTAGDFPVTPNAAIQAGSSLGNTGFAAKLSADGSQFLYATYLPEAVLGTSAIAVDAQGNAYIAGFTRDFHACVVKVSADGSAILYTKLLAGRNTDAALAITVDASGSAFVTGSTASPDFPVTAGVAQPKLA